MKIIIHEGLIKSKIDEYIVLLKSCGFVTDEVKLANIKQVLKSLKIKRIYNAPGDAMVDKSVLSICYENIERNMELYGEYYLDEVLFHEFSHIINSFHKSIYGEDKFIINDFIQNKMSNFVTVELLEESDKLLYNQDSCYGILFLDEFVAQYVAQNLVTKKLFLLDGSRKENYMNSEGIMKYKTRELTTNICEPPITIKTSFADYEEFYEFAKRFINKYGYTMNNFTRESLNSNFVKKFINSLNSNEVEELYRDLCYLGIIRKRVYFLRRFIEIEDGKDAVNNPKSVNEVMMKLLKKQS